MVGIPAISEQIWWNWKWFLHLVTVITLHCVQLNFGMAPTFNMLSSTCLVVTGSCALKRKVCYCISCVFGKHGRHATADTSVEDHPIFSESGRSEFTHIHPYTQEISTYFNYRPNVSGLGGPYHHFLRHPWLRPSAVPSDPGGSESMKLFQ